VDDFDRALLEAAARTGGRAQLDLEVLRYHPTLLAELRPVLDALLDNATDALDIAERPEGTIRVVARDSDGRLRLTITDDGCGMARDIRVRRLAAFRTPGRRAGEPGLAMVHRIVVQRFAGLMFVRSKPGEGTTVHVELPIPAANDRRWQVTAEQIARVKGAA
jgi:signal transduction histidine kinase